MPRKARPIYGGDFAQITFFDAGGVPVFVSLDLDRDGEAYGFAGGLVPAPPGLHSRRY